MGTFIFLAFLFIVGLVLIGKHRIKANVDGESYNFPTWIVGLILVLLSSLFMVISSIQTVGAREVGIPVTFGHIGGDLQPGVHLVAPWTSVHKCSLGQQQSIQSQNPSEGDKQGQDGVLVNGNDQGAGTADVSILYHFDPLHAQYIYRKYACDASLVKQNLIRQTTRSAIGSAAAGYASTDLKSHRADIATAATEILNRLFQNDGIVVDNVVVSDIALSKAAQDAADAKLAAQQAAQQAQFALQKAQTDKQTIEVNAQAAAEANNTKAQSLSPAILCQEWIDAIKEAKPATILTGGPCGGTASGAGVILNAGK